MNMIGADGRLIELIPPWAGENASKWVGRTRASVTACSFKTRTKSQKLWWSSEGVQLPEEGLEALFIRERSRVHVEYLQLRERIERDCERTKRTGLWLSASLIAIACAIPVFAPDGREALSYMVSASLLLFAAGTVGYTAVSLKSQQASLTAGTTKRR